MVHGTRRGSRPPRFHSFFFFPISFSTSRFASPVGFWGKRKKTWGTPGPCGRQSFPDGPASAKQRFPAVGVVEPHDLRTRGSGAPPTGGFPTRVEAAPWPGNDRMIYRVEGTAQRTRGSPGRPWSSSPNARMLRPPRIPIQEREKSPRSPLENCRNRGGPKTSDQLRPPPARQARSVPCHPQDPAAPLELRVPPLSSRARPSADPLPPRRPKTLARTPRPPLDAGLPFPRTAHIRTRTPGPSGRERVDLRGPTENQPSPRCLLFSRPVCK